MTTFQVIQESVMTMLEDKNCPEVTKDILIKMVADEQSLIDVSKALIMLTLICPAYTDFMGKVNKTVLLAVLKQKREER